MFPGYLANTLEILCRQGLDKLPRALTGAGFVTYTPRSGIRIGPVSRSLIRKVNPFSRSKQ